MKNLFLAIITLALLGAVVSAQPPGPRPGNRPDNHQGPAVSLSIRPAPGHHLPPGVAPPRSHHTAPLWRGLSWGVGDLFLLDRFHGPDIAHPGDYNLPPPRPGTHWLYVDGFFLMVGNRTGRIFAEIKADY